MSCVGVDVRAAPPGGRRRAGTGHPPRRDDRADQLDARGLHRRTCSRHEPVRAAAAARRQPPPLWGDEEHVRELFGDRVTDVVATTTDVTIDTFSTAEEFRDFFKSNYGPTISVYTFIGDDAERAASLDRELAELAVVTVSAADRWSGSTCFYTAKKR